MNKIIILFFLLTISIIGMSKADEPIKNTAQNQVDGNTILLQGKIGCLEQKLDMVNQDFDRILQSSQHTWNNILTAVLTIMALLLGGSIFNTFFYVKMKTNKTEESLRNEIAEKLKEIKNEFKTSVDKQFDKLKNEYSISFDSLQSGIYDATGRAAESKFPEVGAIWFARCIDIHMNSERYPTLDEKMETWIKIRMQWIVDGLRKGSKVQGLEYVAEFQNIISRVSGEKYKELKEEMEKALKENVDKQE
jgi:hypothetical protein